jgi:hypothetical protein
MRRYNWRNPVVAMQYSFFSAKREGDGFALRSGPAPDAVMRHAGIRPFEHGPPRLAMQERQNTNHGDVAQVYCQSPRSLEITFHTRNGHGGEFFAA